MITAERNDLPGAEQQRELAGVLRGLRLAAGTTLEDFASEYKISPLQVRFIEDAAAIPARTHLHAYLELVDDDPRTRAHVLKLWSLVHKDHTARRHARRDMRASAKPPMRSGPNLDHEETLLETTVIMSGPPLLEIASDSAATAHSRGRRPAAINRQETRLTLSKPAWRRAAQVSKADSSLWPDPDLLRSAAEFAQALESIKKGTGLSYKMLAQATNDTNYPLASSTVHGMCTKPKLPASVDSVQCFIEVCGGDLRMQRRWAATWQRLRQAPVDSTPATRVPSELAADAEVARQLLVDATTETESLGAKDTADGSVTTSLCESGEENSGRSRLVWTPPEEVDDPDDNLREDEPLASPEVVTRNADPRLYLWLIPLVFVFGAVTGALLLSLLT
ncbi:hypothetical protein SK854_30020 [Lentzea sp. BCCO 10_0061]|uniref:Helix-turn-helix domain-containing protein n=1 Tax=Lentzea sokolovensis TaxID=3095429 RepID=A0ABU4V3W5_9PSEU|nr:hypothetical protein [Lentzea sp. BCCO 10_0061]MDX8146384.1 hypothetical protein [Lentzea sp. BCCO 10_0061]